MGWSWEDKLYGNVYWYSTNDRIEVPHNKRRLTAGDIPKEPTNRKERRAKEAIARKKRRNGSQSNPSNKDTESGK